MFGNWLVIAGLSTCILLWALTSGIRLFRGVRRFRRTFDGATARLSQTPAKAREFVPAFEALSASFQNAPIVGPPWRDWSATLVIPATPIAPVRSTNRPDSYFSLDLLRACGINPRFHAAMPSLLVGIGLLLTFFGLSLALASAGIVVGGDVTPKQRQEGLQTLLNAAAAKFATSLVGLLCSLAYTSFRSGRLVLAERSLDRFLANLEERIPLATPASLQAETNAILERSLAIQTQFATEMAVNIGGHVSTALDQRLGEHIGPLREAIEQLSQGIGTKSEDTLRTLLDQFKDMLHGSTQQHMEKLANALADTSGAMEQIRTGLSEAAGRMASAADQIAEQMGRNAEQAMSRITLQMEGLVEQLRSLAEQSRSAGNDAMAQAAARIAEAGDSFSKAAQDIANSLEQTVSGITSRLGSEAEAATRRMTEELTRAVETMRDLAAQNRAASDDATRAMSDRIAQAAAGFERSAAQISETLASGAGDAAGRLTSAVEELKEQFVRLTAELGGNMEKAGSTFERQGREGAAALSDAAQVAAEALKSGGIASGEALRSGSQDASSTLQSATAAVAAPLRELGQRTASLQEEALNLARAVTAMRQAAAEATTPLRAAAVDFAKAGTSGQRTAADLAAAAERVSPLVDAVSGAMRQLGEAERRLGALSQSLEAALGGFAGLDASLSKVFKDLRDGLSGFATQVAHFVGETNKEMAQAVSALSGAIEELGEQVEDLNKTRP